MIDEKIQEILDGIGTIPFEIRKKADYYLSNEFVERIAIEHGIAIPSKNITYSPIYSEVPPFDKIVWNINGFSYDFINKEAALKLQSLLEELSNDICDTTYDSGVGYDHKYIENVPNAYYGRLNSSKVYSRKVYLETKAILISNKRIKNAFNEAKGEKEEKYEDYDELNKAIKYFVSAAMFTASQWDMLSEKFARYREVLEPEIAMTSFLSVEKPDAKFIEWLKAEKTIESENGNQAIE